MGLKEFMKQNKLTPEEVAKRTGMNLSTVYRHLVGSRKISAEAALKYTRLGISLEDLLTEPTSSEPDQAAANG